MGLGGLEPPTSRLSGVRSNQTELQALFFLKNGAGEGSRTLDISLEGWSFTTKLHPHTTTILFPTFYIISKWSGRQDLNLRPLGPKPSRSEERRVGKECRSRGSQDT